MNCQEAIERLPWGLNGSLESGERREVEEHLRGCASCRQALKETRQAWEIYAQHIPSAALVNYAYDERPEEIAPALLERHLADCPQCAAELEMVRASRLLGEHEDVAVMQRRGAVTSERPSRQRGWKAAALAASLTGLIAIGGWVTSVQRLYQSEAQLAKTTERAAPAPAPPAVENTFLGELSLTVERGPGSEKNVVRTTSAGLGLATLLLLKPQADPYREHVYQILKAGGEVVLRDTPLPLGAESHYSATFDPKLVPPGDYVIRVFGTDDGARSKIGDYPFTTAP